MGRIIVLILLAVVLSEPAIAADSNFWQNHISEAAGRFGIPENWIRSVIKTESNGDAQAISPKGAMGLMQLMPNTWTNIRSAHALGPDPFDPHDNILAGTAYLKAMYDRFGYPALFAAYNAGPTRYEDFLRTGNPLPDETRAYVSGLGKQLSFSPPFARLTASGTRLFFRLSTSQNDARNDEKLASSGDLFVRLSTQKPEEK